MSSQVSTTQVLLRDLELVEPPRGAMAELERLMLMLGRDEGFGLYLLRCNRADPALVHLLRVPVLATVGVLRKKEVRMVWLDPYEGAASRGQLQREQLRSTVLRPLAEARPEETGPGWLWGVDLAGVPQGDGLIWLLERLEHRHRDLQELACPSLVLLTAGQEQLVQRRAGLWSLRRGTFLIHG